jgi:tripartite-type tricarboxylate transporter receptor subunit TctC
MRLVTLLACGCVYCLTTLLSTAWSQVKPYEGKTIRIIVGAGGGGTYDIWARILSRHMGKYVPGTPNFIVQLMPGASALVATNYVYNIASQDGLTLLIPNSNIYMEQLLGSSEMKFDVRKFHWIGAQMKDQLVLFARSDSPYKSLDHVLKAQEPPKCGASGVGSSGYLLPKIVEEVTGAKFTIIRGYQGGKESDLAVERGELHCKATTLTAYFAREPYLSWRKKGFVLDLAQTPTKRDPKLADTPTIYELMDRYRAADLNRRVAKVLAAGGELGNPLAVGPGVSPEKVKILREASGMPSLDGRRIDKVLANNKSGVVINWLPPAKAIWRFATASFNQKRNIFEA